MPKPCSDYERTLYIGDAHIPYLDPAVWEIVLDFARWWKPAHVFNLGDWLDFYQVSKFDKDPARINQLQGDLDTCTEHQAELRAVLPRTTRIVFIDGNHEDRWRKYLWKHPEIHGLRAISIPALLQFDRFRIEHVGILEDCVHNGFVLEHGDRISKHSAYTAKMQMEARGVSGISGHSHRLGTFYRTDYGGDKVWYENGCLCGRNPEYVKKPNWQNGFTVGYHKPTGRFELYQIPIVHNKASFNTLEFAATGEMETRT